jgi:hypothetical protein
LKSLADRYGMTDVVPEDAFRDGVERISVVSIPVL